MSIYEKYIAKATISCSRFKYYNTCKKGENRKKLVLTQNRDGSHASVRIIVNNSK